MDGDAQSICLSPNHPCDELIAAKVAVAERESTRSGEYPSRASRNSMISGPQSCRGRSYYMASLMNLTRRCVALVV